MRHKRRTVLSLFGASIAGVISSPVGRTTPDDGIETVPAHESNYEDGTRSAEDVDWIILHTAEGSFEDAIETFTDPMENVSAHYVVGTKPGQITNMVQVEDVAWAAGNGGYNDRAINIELEGHSSDGFPDQLYENVATLVNQLCGRYRIPKRHPGVEIAPCDPADGQGGVIGHVQVPHPDDCTLAGGVNRRTDPGPQFRYDWVFNPPDSRESTDPDPAFEVGMDVVSTAEINVRSSAEVTNNVKHTQPAGIEGTISNGYLTSEGYVWWWVHWSNGVGGWSVQRYLDPAPPDRQPPQPITNTTDLRRQVDVRGAQLDEAIRRIRSDSPLIGLGDTWVSTQEETGVDAIYQAAHAIWESGWGTSDIAQDKRNLYGFDARDACPYECADGFDSFEQSIRKVMQYVRERYLSPDGTYHNGPHLKGMNVKYATDPNWDTGITDVYNRLVEHLPDASERDDPDEGSETPSDETDSGSEIGDSPGPNDSNSSDDGTGITGPAVPDERPSESSPSDAVEAERYADKRLACRRPTCWFPTI